MHPGMASFPKVGHAMAMKYYQNKQTHKEKLNPAYASISKALSKGWSDLPGAVVPAPQGPHTPGSIPQSRRAGHAWSGLCGGGGPASAAHLPAASPWAGWARRPRWVPWACGRRRARWARRASRRRGPARRRPPPPPCRRQPQPRGRDAREEPWGRALRSLRESPARAPADVQCESKTKLVAKI